MLYLFCVSLSRRSIITHKLKLFDTEAEKYSNNIINYVSLILVIYYKLLVSDISRSTGESRQYITNQCAPITTQ